MVTFVQFVTLALALALPSSALLFQSPADIPSNSKYDFVIVGGGTSGSVLATRLTELPNLSVLVLEAGPSNRGIANDTIPFYGFYISAGTPIDWNYTTIAQPNLYNRSLVSRAGHVLGGGSSVNGMIYTRGSSSDWDRLANVSGDPSWSWSSIFPYFFKIEALLPPSSGKNVSGECNPAIHGTDGPLGISMPGITENTDARVWQTVAEMPDEFPFVLDYNDGVPLGMGWVQSTIRDGVRSSAAYAYLTDEVLRRPNLDVVVNARVARVGKSSSDSPVDTVDILSADGTTKSVSANLEVIVSSGTIGSTRVLLNSGIGPAETIASLNVPLIANISDVGQNLQDQIMLPFVWYANTTSTVDLFANNLTIADEALRLWETNKTGRYASGEPFQAGFFRLNESDPTVQQMIAEYGDPSSGPLSPHMEMVPINGDPSGISSGDGYYFSLVSVTLTPFSRGYVTVDPSDPLGPPIVNPNYLDNPMDLFILTQCLRRAITFSNGSAWDGYLLDGYFGLTNVIESNGSINQTALEDNVRANAVAGDHQIGTNVMSPYGANYGVVDPDFKVKGVNGLRVVDISTFPYVPAGHTEAVAYILSERASDLIKAEYA